MRLQALPTGQLALLTLSVAAALALCACARPAQSPAQSPPPPSAGAPAQPANAVLVEQVRETERAFARTMAARDHAAFTSFLSAETIFFSGEEPLRGAQAVADGWKRFYEKPEAPFSWDPQDVVVLDSGTLALSSGPVRDPAGNLIATFNSIWRQEAPGTWRIIFDKGSEVCGGAS